MKLSRIVCDLCPTVAPHTATHQLKVFGLTGQARRGAPTAKLVKDLCENHYTVLTDLLGETD